tara:strand:+ start:121 stop:435 length:315 start_codon:yes stop_codon:yes gene_type:complete
MNNEHKPKPRRSPWRIHRLEKGFEIFWRDDGDGVESYTYVATARQHSNARRIAAAPEMLAVLVAARASISDALSPDPSTDWRDSLTDALDAINATINDATKEEA